MIFLSGLGLAAPQVGHNLRIIAARLSTGIEVMFNPEITRRGRDLVTEDEGCLSIPGLVYPVERNRVITVKWTDEASQVHERKFTAKDARILQHEIDHLDGKLING